MRLSPLLALDDLTIGFRDARGCVTPAVSHLTCAVRFGGVNLLDAPDIALRHLRGAGISLVLQEPVMALHPLRRVCDQVGDVLAHMRLTPTSRHERAVHGRLPRVLPRGRSLHARLRPVAL